MSFLSQVCTAAARRSTLPFFIAFSVAVLHVVPVAAQTVRCAKGTLPTAARVGLPTSSVAAAGQNSISSVSRDAGALVRGGQSVSSLGADLFGDSVNLYTGSFSISQSDVSIPGNSALPVSLGRAFSAKDGRYTSGAFGDWDLELPSIGGQFATGTRNGGWDTINNKGTPQEHQRCTYFGEPELAASNDNDAWWEGFEYWQGSTLNVPGGGNQEVLWRASGNTTVPADGNAWPLVTKSGWQLRCLPGLHAANINTSRFAKGEGFMAKAPDGTTYRFDWLVVRPTKVATRGKNGVTRYLIRSEVAILPTLITDAFGNTVTYSYNPAVPTQLLSIVASDGRQLTFTYFSGTDQVQSASDGARAWAYAYTPGPQSWDTGVQRTTYYLSGITLPDGSTWRFNLQPLHRALLYGTGHGACPNPTISVWADDATGTVTHPSGAIGTFTTRGTVHGRKVNTSCTMVYDLNAGQYVAMGWSWFPLYWGSRALVSKSISGPGIATMNWNWTYPPAQGGLSICTTCPNVKSVITTDPAGVVSRQTFGIHSQVNEGWLVQLDEAWNGSNGLRTTSYQYRDKAAGPYPSPVGYSGNPRSDALASQHHTPQAQRIVTQQGVNFTWQANSFDSFARAVSVTRLSSLGYSKTESTAYNDNLTKWMLGRLASVTDSGGAVERQTTYNATTGLPTASFGYGRLLKSYEHYANGLLNVQRDAVGRGTVYTAYMRGVPQSIVYPDAAAESAVVNGLGWVTSTTNAVGTTTSYGYDAAGRLASISYPGEAGFAYHPTTLTYEQVPAAEYGIAAGHWRQTLSTGNSTTVRYLDALWRTRLERTWDRANEGATSRIAETRYDFGGREAFVSYPQRSLTGVDGALLGASSTYDALGRVTTQTQDSELGALSTVTAYLGNFQTRVTNSRGHASTFSYQAFDQPSEGTITSISAPEGVTVSIVRDVFGKPNAITRAGTWAGSGLSATRRYGYDAHQRLCKTIEPETGATIQAYDVAGNLAWRASGQSSTSTAACDQASVAAGSKVSFGYDARNRLTGTTFGDGQPGIARSYTPDSLLLQVVSSSFTWTYAYNNRRLLVQEQFSVPGQAPGAGWNFSWGVDAHGSVSSLSDPWGTMSYAPNALGEPTQVSGYASAVSYHPNGAVAGYTLANGITRGVSLNARGLPAQWQDAGVVNDQYSYDANGNVTGIQDLLQGINTRSLGYDGLDRLTTANGPWGSGQFGYDALDNLRSSQLGGRTLTHAIDPTTNRLTGLSGSQSVAMGYDTNGNLAQRGAQGYGFDIGNRMRAAWGKASYDYDGHGRRSWVVYADASTLLNAYSGTGAAGQLRFSAHSVKGNTRYVYLGDKLIAETNSQTGTRFSHTDALGSPVARTNSSGVLLERTRYEPYGATVAGSTNPASIGFTGHVNDADTGLLYMHRKRLGAAP